MALQWLSGSELKSPSLVAGKYSERAPPCSLRNTPKCLALSRGNALTVRMLCRPGMLLASSSRLIFGGPVIALWLTGKSLSAVK